MKTSVVVLTILAMFCLGQQNLLSAQTEAQIGKKYFLDVHKLEPGGVTYADVAGAHEKDLETEKEFGVSFVTYWVDEKAGYVYCLSKASNASDVRSTHAKAHGLIPASIAEVVAGEQSNYNGNGSLFLDVHELGAGNVTAAAVADAHMKDLDVQGERNVNFINYWVDEQNGKVYCLSEAPNRDAVIATHTEAHGLVPVEVLEVKQGQ